MGVVTGIVQEFQFGMNWSDYSRFVGDIFGAPLAIEALLAFFLESTFLGLWIFGWDRLPKRVHLACIWVAAIGTSVGVLHPRRELVDAAPGRLPVNPETRPGRADRLRGRADQLDRAGHLPAHHRRRVPDRRRASCSAVSAVAPARAARRSDRACSARRCGSAPWTVLVAGVGVVDHRRHPGQDHDRAAADEDGRRRGALRDRRSRRASRCFTIGTLDGSEEVCQRPHPVRCCRSWPPARSTARSRASTTSRAVRAAVRRPATTRRTSRSPTGPSG